MTLYDLTNEINIQGNICIIVFDPDGNETERRYFRDQSDFNAYYEGADDLDNCEVSFIYPTHAYCETAWLNIELIKEDDE